jgi:hypothetical protein
MLELTPQFDIPKEGSILIVPPKRDFVREKIPSKFKHYVEEAIIRTTTEQDEICTLGKAQEEILSQILDPLKQGDGVVFVASNFNAEMEEIALFLLIISEICGCYCIDQQRNTRCDDAVSSGMAEKSLL